MPMMGIEQPKVIPIDDALRLIRYNGEYDFALTWYSDVETVYLVDGVRKPYTADKLTRMYRQLNAIGELYFIEVLADDGYLPIGDVAFWRDDMPIVIGDSCYRGKGNAKRVVRALIARAKQLRFSELTVREIYTYNLASHRLFSGLGFVRIAPTKNGFCYRLDL